MAKSGPMHKKQIAVAIKPALAPIGRQSSSIEPPKRAMAMAAITGIPVPVNKKPIAVGSTLVPDCKPKIGGKIILPAPTYKAKLVMPSKIISFTVSLVITREPSQQVSLLILSSRAPRVRAQATAALCAAGGRA